MENEEPITDSIKKACIFNDYFVAQTELDGVTNVPSQVFPFQTSNFLSDIVATPQEILKFLNNVDKSKSFGHDGIGNKIINLCYGGFHMFFLPVLLIYRSS